MTEILIIWYNGVVKQAITDFVAHVCRKGFTFENK